MSDDLIERLRETQELYERAGVDGSEGALQAREAIARITALEAERERCRDICDRWHRKALERLDATTDPYEADRHEECASTAGSLAAAIMEDKSDE